MKNISPLNNVHELGYFGNFENKKDNEIIKIKEIKNVSIYQIVKFKSSNKKYNELSLDNLSFLNTLKVNSNDHTRILWMGPNNWLIVSKKNLSEELKNNYSSNDFAVTDISHSRSIIEIQGLNAKEVLKKGSPFDIEKLKENDCANTVFNGITITIDNIQESSNKIRIISLRSFGESLYHSVTDACLEFGYEAI